MPERELAFACGPLDVDPPQTPSEGAEAAYLFSHYAEPGVRVRVLDGPYHDAEGVTAGAFAGQIVVDLGYETARSFHPLALEPVEEFDEP